LRVRTDDEIYRIDAVWLGPPRATFPWRATYASYLLGFLIFLAVLFVQRRMGIAFGIFPTAWALVITVFLTRVVSRKVNYEKGVVQLFEHFWHEVTGPRARTRRQGAAVRSNHVRVRFTSGPSMRRAKAGARGGRPAVRSAGRPTRPGQPARTARPSAQSGPAAAGAAGQAAGRSGFKADPKGTATSSAKADPKASAKANGKAGVNAAGKGARPARPSRLPRPRPTTQAHPVAGNRFRGDR
jgi:hypothetical protein